MQSTAFSRYLCKVSGNVLKTVKANRTDRKILVFWKFFYYYYSLTDLIKVCRYFHSRRYSCQLLLFALTSVLFFCFSFLLQKNTTSCSFSQRKIKSHTSNKNKHFWTPRVKNQPMETKKVCFFVCLVFPSNLCPVKYLGIIF